MAQMLVIRADANTQIGTGHIMRCLALAQAWQDGGGEAIFMMAMKVPALEERLKSEQMRVVNLLVEPGSSDDALQTANLALETKAIWVVVDGYHFSAGYQRIIKELGLRLVVIDDYGHAHHYYADFVLNQNIYAHDGLYANKAPYTQLLLGIRYVLLRREFTKWRTWQRKIPNVASKVLVTLGGADSENVTLQVIQALQQIRAEKLEVLVVLGASNPHYVEIESVIRDSPFPIQLQSNVENMSELMAWADIAISGGGTTSWELAFMGLPTLILVLADNQQPIAEWLDTKNVAIHLSDVEELADQIISGIQQLFAPKVWEDMSRSGRDLVDGKGAQRIVRLLKRATIKLRSVQEEDCELLWKWSNDPTVRMASFSSDPIPWQEHTAWFNRKVRDPNCIIYMALNEQDIPLGQVRYQIDKSEAVISITIAKDFRGLGYATALIRKASQKFWASYDVHTIHAYIKPSNEASVRAFVKASFNELAQKMVRGSQARHFILKREKDEAA